MKQQLKPVLLRGKCSSYRAERWGIRTVLEDWLEKKLVNENLILFTDSRSNLQALEAARVLLEDEEDSEVRLLLRKVL